ncbi:MAG: CsiV family protein [Pseudomonadales bacterium]
MAASEPDPIELLQDNFYRVELIVFMRLNTSEANTKENLTALQLGRQPERLSAFRSFDGSNRYPFELEDRTRRMLRQSQFNLSAAQPSLGPPSLRPLLPPANARVAEVTQEFGFGWLGAAEAVVTGENSGFIDRTPVAPANEPAPIDPAQLLLEALTEQREALHAGSYAFSSGQLDRLQSVASSINRSRGYRLLLTGSWHQPVPPRNAAEPLLIQTGQRNGDLFQLEGSVSVAVGRYLHFGAHLWYHEPELGAYSEAIPIAELPTPEAPALNADSSIEDVLPEAQPDPEASTAYRLVVPPGEHFMHLSEYRRMRSAELHYIDHPKLGVLVRIDPVPLSEAVLSAYEATQSLEQ